VILRVAAQDMSPNGALVPKGTSAALSSFAVNRSRAVGRRPRGARGRAVSRWGGWGSRCREQFGNALAKVGFRCLFAVVIGGFHFEQDGKREVVVKAGSRRNPKRYTRFG